MEEDRKSRLGKDEVYSLIEDYFSSGELPSAFYRRVGLSDKQFYALPLSISRGKEYLTQGQMNRHWNLILGICLFAFNCCIRESL